MTDELLGVAGVAGVAEVVKGVDEDVGADDKVEGARRESSYCAFGVNRGTYTAEPGR
jgi:hypothetical protein